ncbi:uncharacterized protein LOC141607124 [Silene latifolia]|uniref:uncharacterized protein LOC141607124 n=1 Tax=Silene latifolia TaxID=37657 RepID=UPI003D778BF4
MTNSEVSEVINSAQQQQQFSIIQVENTGSNITQIAFNGSNYDEWSRSFHLALIAKGKEGYIDGITVKPAESAANFSTWRATNALVTGWIFNSIEANTRRTISTRPEAKQIWLDIKNRFCQGNDSRVFQLEAELIACRQGSTETLMSYYGRMIKIWDDILMFDPLLTCDCNPYHCYWVTKMDAQREKKRARDFLMGLDARFDTHDHKLSVLPLFLI